jgi:hypothetical protein
MLLKFYSIKVYYMLRAIILVTLLCITTTAYAQNNTIVTESTTNSNVNTTGSMETTVNSPPPSAIAPNINTSNSDICTIGVSGAVQTQILGLAAGATVRDMNCERLKLAKTMFDMGMKVAAVSVMCQDERIFQAMIDAGTPCPYEGLIGSQARQAWENDPGRIPGAAGNQRLDLELDDNEKKWLGGGAVGALLLLLLL